MRDSDAATEPATPAGTQARITLDGNLIATRAAVTRLRHIDDAELDATLVDTAAEIAATLDYNDPALLVIGTGDHLAVATADFATVTAARHSEQHPHASTGAHIIVTSADGWVALSVRSLECGGANAGKIVGSVGETANPDDITDGHWNPESTAHRGLREEAGLDLADYHLELLALLDFPGGDIAATYRADTTLERDTLEVRMTNAEDAWERSAILWWRLERIADLLDDDLDWGTWGATTTALAAVAAGVDTTGRRIHVHTD